MFNKGFNAEEMLETGVSSIKKQVTSQVKATGNAVSSQFGNSQPTPIAENLTTQTNSAQSTSNQDQATNDFVKDLYATSDPLPNNPLNSNNQNNNQSVKATLHGKIIDEPKTPEEVEKLARARKALLEQHMATYYRPTFETPKQPQEDTAEKLEREKQEEEVKKMEELKTEQKKNEVPLAVRMGAQKAEKFRGAAG